MIVVESTSNNPFFNHALEAYFLKETGEDLFVLWRNQPSVLIGTNQNTLAEINQAFVKAHQIHVVRRLSGGGTVFCDLGNINFTFITTKRPNQVHDFSVFAKPVVTALVALGVPATFSGRNDILVDNMKVSGNAQYHYKNRLLHHGTLLFDGNLQALAGAIQPRPEKLKTKGIQSVRSRVTNIRPHLNIDMEVRDFMAYLQDQIMAQNQVTDLYQLSPEETAAIEAIQKEQFESYEWNYGKSPSCQVSHTYKHPFGLMEYYIAIKKGRIKDIHIRGDFFGTAPIHLLENLLTDCPYDRDFIHKKLLDVPVPVYISGMTAEQLSIDLTRS